MTVDVAVDITLPPGRVAFFDASCVRHLIQMFNDTVVDVRTWASLMHHNLASGFLVDLQRAPRKAAETPGEFAIGEAVRDSLCCVVCVLSSPHPIECGPEFRAPSFAASSATAPL